MGKGGLLNGAFCANQRETNPAMIHRPMLFFTACGCPSSSIPCAAPAPTCDPCGTAIIQNDLYYTLTSAPKGKLLIVVPGTNSQAFLTTARGFLFDDGSGLGVQPTQTPQVTLPILNPAVSGNHPATGTFKFMFAGSNGDPSAWNFLAAPTAGEYMVQSEGGVWKLVDVGTIPGLTGVGASATFAPIGQVLSLVETSEGSGEYVVRKLKSFDERPIVGVDDDDGTGIRSLPLDKRLTHPFAFFGEMSVFKFVPSDAAGEPLGELPELPEGVTDAKRMLYSAAQKKIFRPSTGISDDGIQLKEGVTASLATGSFHIIADFGTVATGTSIFVSWSCETNLVEQPKLQLWVDGASVHEWDYSTASTAVQSQFSGAVFHTGLVEGDHEIELRFRPFSGPAVVNETHATLLNFD